MKPICCGDRSDAELLLAASSEGLTIDELNPVWLKTPAAPFSASQIEDVEIAVSPLVERLADLQRRFDFVVVEGVGGWLVPLRRDVFVSDLAAAMHLPVVTVALSRLGCLNHTMLTVRSIAACGVTCAGVVLNTPPAVPDFAAATNHQVLAQISEVPIISGLDDGMRELPPEWRVMLGGVS